MTASLMNIKYVKFNKIPATLVVKQVPLFVAYSKIAGPCFAGHSKAFCRIVGPTTILAGVDKSPIQAAVFVIHDDGAAVINQVFQRFT